LPSDVGDVLVSVSIANAREPSSGRGATDLSPSVADIANARGPSGGRGATDLSPFIAEVSFVAIEGFGLGSREKR
jgi:hypothetical protein